MELQEVYGVSCSLDLKDKGKALLGKNVKKKGCKSKCELIQSAGDELINSGQVMEISVYFFVFSTILTMKIISWNIQGLNRPGKQRYLRERIQ